MAAPTGVVVQVEVPLPLDVVAVGVLAGVVGDAQDAVDGVPVVLSAGRVRDDADAARRLLRTAAVGCGRRLLLVNMLCLLCRLVPHDPGQIDKDQLRKLNIYRLFRCTG